MKIKGVIPKSIKFHFQKMLEQILLCSLESAAKEQGLKKLAEELQVIVPDINEKYSTSKIDSSYLRTKARNLHAFQVSLIREIIEKFKNAIIVDIGDSSGTHLQYIIGLFSVSKDIKCLSINLDKEAIERIEKKGLQAIHARAEDLHRYNVNADVFLCFETLEHLMDPCNFLHSLSEKTNAQYLIISVPYLRNSRVGLHHIRADRKDNVFAENTHIFELSPDDWKLIMKHSGWNILKEKIYLQYPRIGFLRIVRPLWKRFDFEGFYGLILKRDKAWSSKYSDWKENGDAQNCNINNLIRNL